MGSEEYDDEETTSMPPEMQLLDPSKTRETDMNVIATHLESLLMLTTTKDVRSQMREISTYPVVRELHLAVNDEKVRELCERLVDVLQRDDAIDDVNADTAVPENLKIEELDDDDDEIVDIV